MSDKTEQAIIAMSATATKVSGTATAASGTVGWMAFMLDHQQIFLLLFAFFGLVITIITAAVNARYVRKKDCRESLEHEKKMAIQDFKLEEMRKEAEHKRRADDKE